MPGLSDSGLSIDLRIYRLEALKRSLYRFSGEAVILSRVSDEQTAHVSFPATENESAEEGLRRAFLADLIDQEMRCVVHDKTASLRDVILAQAYTPVSLACASSNTADWESDPLNVDKPDKAKQEFDRVPR